MNQSELEKLSHEHPILLYDGDCILCNNVIQWSWSHDKQGRIRYSTLQKQASESNDPIYKDLTTVVLLKNGKQYIKSDAIIQLLLSIGGVWLGAGLFKIIPRRLRDVAYSWISANRYRWFGKKESCMLPPVGWADRFID